jgi:hypothetical protein
MMLILRPSKLSVCLNVATATSDVRVETENKFVVELEFWKCVMILFSTCQNVFCWLLGLRRQQCCYVCHIVAILWSVLAKFLRIFHDVFQNILLHWMFVKCLFYISLICSSHLFFCLCFYLQGCFTVTSKLEVQKILQSIPYKGSFLTDFEISGIRMHVCPWKADPSGRRV